MIVAGAMRPQEFRWDRISPLLTLSDLWEAIRTTQPGLLMRWRSDGDPGEHPTTKDEPESVIGLVDPTMRWRASLAMARAGLMGLRVPACVDACWQGMALLAGKHPAAINTGERHTAIANIQKAMESLPENNPQMFFENAICHSMTRFMLVDNDLEAARAVPFEPMLMINVAHSNNAHMDRRQSTIETLAGAAALGEAHVRLLEKIPDWFYTQVPRLTVPGAEPPAERPKPRPVPTTPPREEEEVRPAPPPMVSRRSTDDDVLARMGEKVPKPEPGDEDYEEERATS